MMYIDPAGALNRCRSISTSQPPTRGITATTDDRSERAMCRAVRRASSAALRAVASAIGSEYTSGVSAA